MGRVLSTNAGKPGGPGGPGGPFDRFRRYFREGAIAGANEVMDLVGTLATGKYMRLTKLGAGAPVADRLTVRSGRLARSLEPGGGAFGGPGKREQIRIVRWQGDNLTAIFGTKVPYAAVHELGLTVNFPPYTHPNLFGRGIRAQMGARTAQYPKRPFLSPAAREAGKQTRQIFANKTREAIRKAGL